MRVECEVEEVTNPSTYLSSLRVECSRCGHVEEAAGTGDASRKRALVMLRENCPNSEHNFYFTEEDE